MWFLERRKQIKEKKLDEERNEAILLVCKAFFPELDTEIDMEVYGKPLRFCTFHDQKLIIRAFYVMLEDGPMLIEAEVDVRDKYFWGVRGVLYEPRTVYTVLRCERDEYCPGDWERYLLNGRAPEARKILQRQHRSIF